MHHPDIEHLICSDDSRASQVPANQRLFNQGDRCNNFVYVKKGRVRVELLSTTGHQLLLYRINAGQSCVMTTACLLGDSVYFAQAITETETDLVLMPQSVFQTRLADSGNFREFVFQGFSERLAALMQRTAELATYSVDQRLATVLSAQARSNGPGGVVTITHEQLAIEIGTAREVVSRRLAAFEKQGLLTRQRGSIEIPDLTKLTQQRPDNPK